MSSLIIAASTKPSGDVLSASSTFIIVAFVVLALVIFAVRMLVAHGGKSDRTRP